ncbi:MAG: hypothetical protein DRH21_01570 [Deltaproteobacteria bacterium]|nr:MAG: hypothetical protein DRH21_01570 [Deltaproteobacteria bacterium]
MKYELRSSKQYDKWFAKLKDSSIKIKVLARLDQVENGNFGDFKQTGGDKSTQSKDIERAAELLNELKG